MTVAQPWQPKRWLATLLSLVLYASGLLYLGQIRLVVGYWLGGLALIAGLYIGAGELYAMAANTLLHIASAIHSYKIASNYPLSRPRPWYSNTWGMLVSVLALFILPIFLVRAFLFEPFRIPSYSMAPNFLHGDFIVISKWGYGNYGAYGIELMHTPASKPIRRGDVVVFAYPPEPSIDFIKRVVGLPGDHISYKNKQLYVNNQLIELAGSSRPADLTMKIPEYFRIEGTNVSEKYEPMTWQVFKTNNLPGQDIEVHLSEKQYFMLGDNRDNSNDSRYWGPVPAQNIKGLVIYHFAR